MKGKFGHGSFFHNVAALSRPGGSSADSERTVWVSDSLLIAVVPSGAGMALRFSVTALLAVGTIDQLSFQEVAQEHLLEAAGVLLSTAIILLRIGALHNS